MKKYKKTIYYNDELKDEFADDDIKAKTIDGTYRYSRVGFAEGFAHIFWYRVVATPLAWLYMKLHFGIRVVNKQALKEAGKNGFFLYGNHTHFLADALLPTVINVPRDVSTIVHPNNVSMPVLGRITPYLGALPLPDDAEAAKNFLGELDKRVKDNNCIMIYPEAHIWPYYTDIRPFTELSFKYPVKYKLPAFCITNTYQKRVFRSTPRMVTYVDGPFYADEKLPPKDRKKELRDRVYNQMKVRAKESNVSVIEYVKRGG